MSTQLPNQHDKCGACSFCTNSKKPMTNAQKAIVYSFNKKQETDYINSLSPKERDEYYKIKAIQQKLPNSLFKNGSINESNRGSFKRF